MARIGSVGGRVAAGGFATGLALVDGRICAVGTSPALPNSGSGAPNGEAFMFRSIGKPFQLQMSELVGARGSSLSDARRAARTAGARGPCSARSAG